MIAGASRPPIADPAVWRATDLADPDAWTVQLTNQQRLELVGVARAAQATGRTITTLELGDVPLPSFSPVLERIVDALVRRHGFILLRGFPIEELSPEETELAYLALGLHLGAPVSQDGAGSLLGHVRDERVIRSGPEVRLYRTRERQDFHTDGADIIGLLCLRGARSGGESKLASSYAVYNEILRRRPDLLDVLYEPMWWDRNDEQPEGEPPAYPLPILHDLDGQPRVFFIGWYIRDAQRHREVPRLTRAQREALDLIEAIANDPSFHVSMEFRPGDVQLLNNAKILHAREAYDDLEDVARRRHLLRLWLSARDFTSVEDQLRAGIPRQA